MSKPPRKSAPTSAPTDDIPDGSLEEIIDRQIGDLVSQKQRDVIVARMTSLMVSEHFSGPLPHPKHLSGYEQTLSGSANRIISMAEDRQGHHMKMDERILSAEVADRKLGMWLGFSAFLALVIAAFASGVITKDYKIAAVFLAAAAIGGIGMFVKGRANNG